MINRDQVIVAQGHKGHRLMYVRILAERAIELGRTPIVALSADAFHSEEFATHLSTIASRAQFVRFDGVTLKSLLSAIPENSAQYPIVFSEGDGWLLKLVSGPKLPAGATVLVMRARSQSPHRMRSIAESVAKRVLRSAVRLRGQNRVFTLAAATWANISRWEVPDPGTISATEADARSARKVWEDSVALTPSKWIGVVGGIGKRKNIDVVAKAVSLLGKDYGLVLAGEAEDPEKTINSWLTPARDSGIAVVRSSGTLSEQDFDATICALDCVILAHSNEGPSGIFAKAIVAGTPIVAAGARSLKQDCANSGGHAVWTELTAECIASAIMSRAGEHTNRSINSRSAVRTFCDRLLQHSEASRVIND